jgi:glycine/D-amino acid oxidase-like deaminating enzyme
MSARHAEVVIAGAGIAGIAAAYHLAVREGITRIVVVDPRDPLSLTSSRGAEAYRNYWPGPDRRMAGFMDRSIDLLEALDQASGHAFDLNRRGYVFLTAEPEEAQRLQASTGPTADFLADARAIRSRYPCVTERVIAMLRVQRAGYMNARLLGEWLLAQARRVGVDVVRDEVVDLIVESERCMGIRLASGARLDAGAFVLAAGPLLPEWTDRIGLDVPIVNELHGKISFEDHDGVIPRDAPMMIWNDAVDLGELGAFPAGIHLRPRGVRSVLGIWTYDTRIERPSSQPVFPRRYADIVLRGLTVMIPDLHRYVASAAEALVDGGYYCKAPDNRPVIGPTAIAGVYVLGALSGFGIMGAQAGAELVAAYLLEQPLPDYAAAFHPARFTDPLYRRTLGALDTDRGQL